MSQQYVVSCPNCGEDILLELEPIETAWLHELHTGAVFGDMHVCTNCGCTMRFRVIKTPNLLPERVDFNEI